MTETSTWPGMWAVLFIISLAYLIALGVRALIKTGNRLDRDIPRLLADPDVCEAAGHRWAPYANYRLCLGCGDREDQPFDQDLTEGTDLHAWNREVES